MKKTPKSSSAAGKLTLRVIRAVLRRHRKAQADLARELGVSRSAINHWLNGRRGPSERIATAAAKRAAELLAEEKQQDSKE